MKDPLAYEILERLAQEKISREKAAKAIGVTELTLGNFLKGKPCYKSTRALYEAWMAPWRAAKEILG